MISHLGADYTPHQPLLLVVGAAGAGKSTLVEALAGTIEGALILDADMFADDLVTVVSPRHDYPEHWRALMRYAFEIGRNGQAVVYCGVMLPEQLLAHAEELAWFDGVHFLVLVCDDDELRERVMARPGRERPKAAIEMHLEFNRRFRDEHTRTPNTTVIDASRVFDDVKGDVAAWIRRVLAG